MGGLLGALQEGTTVVEQEESSMGRGPRKMSSCNRVATEVSHGDICTWGGHLGLSRLKQGLLAARQGVLWEEANPDWGSFLPREESAVSYQQNPHLQQRGNECLSPLMDLDGALRL